MENGFIYKNFIDPILNRLRKRVTAEINHGEKVIDIACGTGAQLLELAHKADSVTGVDLSESMIKYAQKASLQKKVSNVQFHVGDAANLSGFYRHRFNTAILSLALHQFNPELYPVILNEIRKIADKVIVVDYAVPLPGNVAGYFSRIIEFLAGRDHNRNFQCFIHAGGLNVILEENNYKIRKSQFFGYRVFQLVIAESTV